MDRICYDMMDMDVEDERNEDPINLSLATLAALQEFYDDQSKIDQLKSHAALQGNAELDKNQLLEKGISSVFPENWQLSQFWYDEETSGKLANEVLSLISKLGGTGLCISCPSVFRACEMRMPGKVELFEYDRRFAALGKQWHFYDYNEPEDVELSCLSSYSVIIADPPFLSSECLEKVARTIKSLSSEETCVILCTGKIMEAEAEKFLDLKKCNFIPQHSNNLGNEFACFINYSAPTEL